jgi:acylglycerol lipase
VNPIELKSKSGNKEYKLENYRYPSQTGDRKGIIYFIHGFGDYCGRYAYFAKQFAEHGYDFVGFDQRGFGRSEGPRGIFESE